jgi:Carboxypeptidase regulatory-like domain
MKTAIVGLLFIAMASLAQCQLVNVGPPDPHYCDRFKVEPNLTMEQDADVHGRVIDVTGAPFRNSPVELRVFLSPTKQVLSRAVKTDADGNFHIEGVKAAEYRLVASPTRAFQQPAPLRCVKKQCELSITLQVNPTDLPDSQCPVR